MWADNETDEDLLGFEIHANLVKSIVTDPEMLPVTVGLFGDWGGGKSSILKILQRELKSGQESDKDPETLVIYFDSWVFQGYEDAKAAILAVLLQELKSNRKLKDKIWDEASELLARVNWMKAAKFGLAAGASYLAANPLPLLGWFGKMVPKKAGAEEKEGDEKEEQSDENEKWLRDVAESACDVRTFRRDFENMLQKTELKSFVILIDDLDRCAPDRVIDNLEAIKLFLNVKGIAFVIAADRRIIENAIRVRYADVLDSQSISQAERSTLVTDYLEKLVQVPYTLPKLAPHEVRSYLSLLLFKKLLPDHFPALHAAYVKFIRENRYEPFDLRAHLKLADGDNRREEVEERFRIIETCCDPITDGLKGNPRQIKRFLNAMWMRLQLAKVAQLGSLDQAVLIKLMVLEYISEVRFREIYDAHRKTNDGTAEVLRDLEDPKTLATVGDGQKGWQDLQLARWLQTPPFLAQVDLRDYFWLSRSSLDHTFAGVQMVSKAVRTCVDGFLIGDASSRKAAREMHDKLDARERQQVVFALSKLALREPEKAEALQGLLELVMNAGSAGAADALVRVLSRADPDHISIRLASGIAALRPGGGNEAIDRVVKARPDIIQRKGKFGAALERAMKG